jgi:flagellar motor protein MotB
MANNQQIKKEDEALLEAISPIINELIDRNYKNSQNKIASQMAPLIGSAIRQQIKSQKDEIVDALYPVIGNMISRYVSKTFEEMLESINQQIQNGLSAKVIKRKIQSKIQGVSETELLLKENANSNIRALFLIHKETGIVLTHAENPSSPINEPEMLASMMSAIRSFVNEWIEQNQEHQELGEIEFGGNKIIIENAGYSYLAVITNGSVYRSTYDKIRNVLESIVLKYGDEIRNFNGNLATFPNMQIYKEVSNLLQKNKDEQKKEKKLHPLMFIIPILFISWIGWNLYKDNLNETLIKNINTTLYKTPQLTNYRLYATLEDAKVTLKGEVPFKYHKELAYEKISNLNGIKNVNNEIMIVPTLDDPMQISSNISYLIKGFSLFKKATLKYSYDYPVLFIEGTMQSKKDKETLLRELKKIKGVKEIKQNISVVLPIIESTIYFDKGSSKISAKQESKLISLITLLKTLDSDLTIHIKGYGDPSGSAEINKKLVDKRATNIAKYLQNKGLISQKILAQGFDGAPKGVDAIKNPEQARCAILSLGENK